MTPIYRDGLHPEQALNRKRSIFFKLKLMLKLAGVFLLLVGLSGNTQPAQNHNLLFDSLATSWDEGVPLGNAILGALIWEKEGELRLALDRSDLWDQRPMKGLHGPHFSYEWIYDQVKKKDYKVVQQKLDEPYEREPAPTKIPGAALMINTRSWGAVQSVKLDVATAECSVTWKNGTVFRTFVHATRPIGWFRIENLQSNFEPRIEPPPYNTPGKTGSGSVEGDDLNRLGYEQGKISKSPYTQVYIQKGWGGFGYSVAFNFKKTGGAIEGTWVVETNNFTTNFKNPASSYEYEFISHKKWWQNFWLKSSLKVPNEQLEKQWYLEMYKWGSTARDNAPPISLQAVWTADNGRIPPWKGDFHHDLNTQLSYWPAYSGNHLHEAMGYLNHLDSNKENYRRYTKLFFKKDGLNVPGVTTLNGTEMGGWIQYSCSPTVSSWLAHHYYLQWRYSLDTTFLRDRAYPWISETAKFIENITIKNAKGKRQLPISSSPEIFNNDLKAWFHENTNYDLSLMKFVVGAAAELADVLDKKNESAHWKKLLADFEDYSITTENELMFAPGKPYDESHRHFSHVMAIHPLSLIKWEDGEKSRVIIKNSIAAMDRVGPGMWCGYSYSWLGNLKARAKDGEGAAKALEIFSKAFCLKNSFHANGDQTKSGYSTFVYRPFTLEGNFAFASGLQEMLLQSYAGFIEVFPAIPAEWKDVSFETLRAEGAFLVSAKKEDGQLKEIEILAEKGGRAVVKCSTQNIKIATEKGLKDHQQKGDFLELNFEPGGEAVITY